MNIINLNAYIYFIYYLFIFLIFGVLKINNLIMDYDDRIKIEIQCLFHFHVHRFKNNYQTI